MSDDLELDDYDSNDELFSDEEIWAEEEEDPQAQLQQNIIQPLIDEKHGLMRLMNWVVIILVALSLLIAGVSLAVAKNVSDTLTRRSPVLEHILCHEKRTDDASNQFRNLVNYRPVGETGPPTPEEIARANKYLIAYNKATDMLIDSTDPTKKNACPSLPGVRAPKK